MHALESVKLNDCKLTQNPAQISGECDLMIDNFMGFTQEEDKLIEKTLLMIRDKIRRG